jgi:hypothetical protein
VAMSAGAFTTSRRSSTTRTKFRARSSRILALRRQISLQAKRKRRTIARRCRVAGTRADALGAPIYVWQKSA